MEGKKKVNKLTTDEVCRKLSILHLKKHKIESTIIKSSQDLGVVLKGQKLNDSNLWNEIFTELQNDLSDSLKVIPISRKLSFLEKERSEIIFEMEYNKRFEDHVDCLAFDSVLLGEDPEVEELIDNSYKKVSGVNYETIYFKEVISNIQYQYHCTGSYFKYINSGIAYAHLLSFIEVMIAELGGNLIDLQKVNVSKSKDHEFIGHFSWENKTELSELIYSLFKSNRILYKGKPAQLKEIKGLISLMFNTKLENYHDLLSKSMISNKKTIDEKYFLAELLDHVKKYSDR